MRVITAILILGISLSTSAQTSKYAGPESREIKALSKAQIEGYLNGHGMGMAKAAELNHYPGPKHVLDLSKELNLTEEQKGKTEQLFKSMKKEAVRLGKKLVKKERQLDSLFTDNSINESKLQKYLNEIGSLKSDLRFTHMKAHLKQKNILTPHHTKLYDKLRGYGHSGVHYKN